MGLRSNFDRNDLSHSIQLFKSRSWRGLRSSVLREWGVAMSGTFSRPFGCLCYEACSCKHFIAIVVPCWTFEPMVFFVFLSAAATPFMLRIGDFMCSRVDSNFKIISFHTFGVSGSSLAGADRDLACSDFGQL